MKVMMKVKTALQLLMIFSSYGFATLAQAHSGHDAGIHFMAGLMHPFTGFDHFLVILLVGFWSAFALKQVYLGPCSFMLGMLAGIAAGLLGVTLSLFEFGITFSVMAVGLLLFFRSNLSPKLILLLFSLFGVFHGFAHAELFSTQFVAADTGMQLVLEDASGLFLATAFLHGCGVLLATILRGKLTQISKGLGLATLAYGIYLFGQLSLLTLAGAA
jgi:urease accessory protein